MAQLWDEMIQLVDPMENCSFLSRLGVFLPLRPG